ncbi:hypothetical protein ACJZ2D_011815 [Fusarium nematophilum]
MMSHSILITTLMRGVVLCNMFYDVGPGRDVRASEETVDRTEDVKNGQVYCEAPEQKNAHHGSEGGNQDTRGRVDAVGHTSENNQANNRRDVDENDGEAERKVPDPRTERAPEPDGEWHAR